MTTKKKSVKKTVKKAVKKTVNKVNPKSIPIDVRSEQPVGFWSKVGKAYKDLMFYVCIFGFGVIVGMWLIKNKNIIENIPNPIPKPVIQTDYERLPDILKAEESNDL